MLATLARLAADDRAALTTKGWAVLIAFLLVAFGFFLFVIATLPEAGSQSPFG